MKENEMIARFMGARIFQKENYHSELIWWAEFPNETNPLGHDNIRNLSSLEYNYSWDWIMPVIDRIEQHGFLFWLQSTERASTQVTIWKGMNVVVNSISESKLQAVYNAVIQFITYYNTLQNEPNPKSPI